ncbi:MAG: NAD(P)/FAD-dependent oxidoreductase [Clostridia bacterium]|nr:NAD(P)/FAD-dependent oxidoreductase [Clostridia bacterium]
MLRINNLKIRNDLTENEVIDFAFEKFHINKNDVLNSFISKKSIDARKKDDVHYSYSIDIEVKDENKYKKLDKVKELKLPKTSINRTSQIRPVIVGAGPAGLFAALTFVQNGFKPIVIEQGKPVEARIKDVEEFKKNGRLNTMSNVQFGEGGAGTFSDGKLTTGVNSPYSKKVLQEFVNFGAPSQILYLSKPHIGTDNLINIVRNMRNYIISQGGEFLFNEKVTDFEFTNNKITAVYCSKKIETDCVILAIGHSSRDTFEKLYEKGVKMEQKDFSVGVRIEHLQSEINKAQYGTITKLKLPPAEYKLAYHSPNGHSCYTFCMCPGGQVVASSSEENTIVTNGMSNFLRDGKNANSALLVGITPEDFGGSSPLDGIYFQKNLEEKAFKLGGNNYNAPAQRVEDFLENKVSSQIGIVEPSYKPGITLCNLNDLFPEFVNQTLKEGLIHFDTKLKGFAHPDSIMTGVETRTSSPVRILRDDNLVSNIDGLYPCGEGAGYAGGIMTAAIDGIKCAIKILENS